LVKRNYDIELWIVNYSETALLRQLDSRVSVFRLNREHVRNCLFPLFKLFVQQKPERILIFHIELAILAIVLKKMFFLKTKVFIRSINTLSHAFIDVKYSLRNYFMLKVIKNIFSNAHKIIAQSNGMREDLIKSFNIDRNKIATIYNPAINIMAYKHTVSEETDIENEFLFVGRLSPQKGLINLLKAFKLAYEEKSNIHLTLVGEGTEKEMLKKMVINLGLSLVVSFEGYQENTLSYFKRVKATLLTSFFEGFPNVLVESIAVGTPVIAFNCPSGPEDIIVPGVNGILVPHLDLVEFSNAILAIANGEIHFNKQKIINSATNFSTDGIVRAYECVLM
jgi:glycosyltransferase involved in cell wall biosynthesis